MNVDDIKKMMGGKDFAGQFDKLKGVMGKMPGMEDIQKLMTALKPKKQKNTTVTGIDCIISLSIDNKVSITFPDEITATKYYEDFTCEKTYIGQLEELSKDQTRILGLYSDELQKIKDTNWYKFINFFKLK